MTLTIKTFNAYLSVIMLTFINKSAMLSAIILNVSILNVMALSGLNYNFFTI
jgi:hypothetical protein